jgi:serine/threonine protein kinase
MENIGKYKIIRMIGEGGMGRVYEAVDPIIGRRVAIKTIALNIAADAETRARFFREAQAAGQLSHPNLITIHDIGEADGQPYIVMEYLEGADLSRKIRSERMPLDTKLQIMIDMCDGLAFAHGNDVVHRDIKPGNIFITNHGRVKILDFGLARGALSDVTRTGSVVGTPNYMAPEQIKGEEIDHRADIFSAGVVFYELLSGRKAFEGDSIATTIYKVLETDPHPIQLIDAALPAELSPIIEKAIAKDKTARFQSSNELLEALVRLQVPRADGERSRTPSLPLLRSHVIPVLTPPRGSTVTPAVTPQPHTPPPSTQRAIEPSPPSGVSARAANWQWAAIGALVVAVIVAFYMVLRVQRGPESPATSAAAPVPEQTAPPTATVPALSLIHI